MAEQPTERDLIGSDLLKIFVRIRDTREEVEIVSQTPGRIVRCAATGDGDYMTQVEIEAPNITTNQLRYLFENFCSESIHLTDECTSSELYCTEDGQRDRYETVV